MLKDFASDLGEVFVKFLFIEKLYDSVKTIAFLKSIVSAKLLIIFLIIKIF